MALSINGHGGLAVAYASADLDALAPVWERAEAGRGSPMQRLAWTGACADTLERGAPLNVLALDDPAGAAVAPLVLRPETGRLEIGGLSKLGEPADFVWNDEAALVELTERVAADGRALALGRVPADSPTLDAVRAAYRRGFVAVSASGGTPTIALAGPGSEPEAQLSSRRRSDIRRARRRADAMGEVTIEIVAPTPEEAPALLAEAIAIEAQSWKAAAGTALASDPMRRLFFERYAVAAAADGTLRLAFLRIGGVGAAMQIAVECGRRFWLLKIGYDERFGKASPGNLLVLETLRYATERNLVSYEMLGAAEPWTEAWTKELRPHVRLHAYPPRLRAVKALALDGATLAAKQWRTQGRPAVKRRIAPAVHTLAERASRGYVAGETVEDGLGTAGRLVRDGYPVTACYWNAEDDDPTMVAHEYAAIASGLAERGLDGYVSAKAPALRFDLETARYAADAARDAGRRLHFDALGLDSVDHTFALIAALRDHATDLGTTLPGRWPRSVADADPAVEMDLAVRVVKGQFPATASEDGASRMRDGYLDVIDALAGRARHVAVATHDVGLVREAVGRLLTAGTDCEVELLYGLPLKPATAAARSLGVPVRVYVPYGRAWLPYAMSEARSNPRTLWWLARDAALGRRGRA